MKTFIVVGLGNPGKAYEWTRHNIGYCVVEAFAAQANASWEIHKKFKAECAKVTIETTPCILVKSQRFMNETGLTVGPLCSFYRVPPEQLIVVQDDITLPVSHFKISIDGGSGGHNGIADIMQAVGRHFIRLKIGIGEKAISEMELKNHVLGSLTSQEKFLFSAKFPDYINVLKCLITQGPVFSMNQFNQRIQSNV